MQPHPTARAVGPVVAGGACAEVDALIVGPMLFGRGPHARRAPRARGWAPWAFVVPLAFAAPVPAAAQLGPLTVGLTVGAETGAITNPRYLVAGDTTDVVSRAQLGLALARRTARTTASVTGSGNWQHFRVATGLSQFTYAAGAATESRLTPRLTVRGGAAARTLLSRGLVGSGLAAGAPVGATDGSATAGGVPTGGAPAPGGGLPVVPLALTRTYGATAGADFRANARTTLTGGVEVSRVTFDSPGLIGGTSVRGRGRAARQVTSQDVVGLAAEAERTSLGGRPLDIQSTSLDWGTERLPHALRLRLAAGATAFSGTRNGRVVRPVGGVDLSSRAARGTWGVRYARSLSPVFGIGEVLVTDQVGGSYERVVPGGLVARVRVDRAWLYDPTLQGQRFVTTVSSAELQRAIVAGLWAGVSGSQYTRAQGQAVRSRGATLRAGYAHTWGAGSSSRPASTSSATP